jgi:multiple sugar transport system ATP-binding protein
MASVTFKSLRKVFPNGHVGVDNADFTIGDGELLVLVGPSGCGKSTLLRLIAGLEEATAGSIFIGDREVTHLAPRDRDIAMVFQS